MVLPVVIQKLEEGVRLGDLFIQISDINDIDRISDIEMDCHPSPWSKNSISEIINRKWAYTYFISVKDFINKKIIAYICFQFINNELYLLNITVDKNFRRRGLAKGVLEFLINLFKKQGGCERVVLDVRPQNIAAVELYKKLGFVFADLIRKENSKVMCLDLN